MKVIICIKILVTGLKRFVLVKLTRIVYFTAVMHAAIFGNVTAIIHGQYSSNFRYRKESLQINEFVRYFKIKNPLARRLRDYSRHTWSQTKGTDMAKVCISAIEMQYYYFYDHPALYFCSFEVYD